MKRMIWSCDRAGSLRRLRLAKVDLPEPSHSEVQIDVEAIGLNFADIFALLSLYSATPQGAFIPGLELSGRVAKLGDGVKGLRVGDAVIGLTRFGAYATRVNIDENYCFPLPDGWSFSEGAAFPVQALTAWYGLRTLGQAKRGEVALIHSAAGGVGLMALAIGRKLGLELIGTVGHEKKKVFLRERGFQDVILRGASFPDDLKQCLRGRDLDIIMDGIGGALQKQSFDCLGPGGRLVVFGAAEHMPRGPRPNYMKSAWRYFMRPRYDALEMISSNRSVMGFNLIWLWNEHGRMKELLEELHKLEMEAPLIGAHFPFEDAPSAIAELKSGKSVGKVVLEVKSRGNLL